MSSRSQAGAARPLPPLEDELATVLTPPLEELELEELADWQWPLTSQTTLPQ